MKEKTLDEQISEKRNKLTEIHGSLAVYLMAQHTNAAKAKVGEIQDRLEFRTKEYELQLLTEKVALFGEALSVLKADHV